MSDNFATMDASQTWASAVAAGIENQPVEILIMAVGHGRCYVVLMYLWPIMNVQRKLRKV